MSEGPKAHGARSATAIAGGWKHEPGPMMRVFKGLLERGALVVGLPIATLFVTSLLFAAYGTYLAGWTVVKAASSEYAREVTELAPKIFSVIDVYLLALVLYIFAVGLYELFVGELVVPEWLSIETVDELKAKLASVVVLFVAIAFVKVLVDWKNPQETLMYAVATGILIFALVHYYKAKEHH